MRFAQCGRGGAASRLRRCAFSLVELLVVIALILVLTTLYWGSTTNNRGKQSQAACQQNLEKIYIALEIYANEHESKFPASAAARTSEEALNALVPHYTADTSLFICPGSKDQPLASGERVAITDTRKGEAADRVLHIVAPGSSLPQSGEAVVLEIDWQRRYQLMRLHTALHLLSCVIVAPVTGGNIVADKARLDFDIELSLLNAARIESETNALIASGIATESVWITDAELDAQPELVKTMSVQPPRGAGRVRLLRIPGIDLQPCGGTHVANIAEIGWIRVLRIRSEGRHNKRVEIALTGSG